MHTAEILSPWTQLDLGDDVTTVPQVAVDYRLDKWSDTTGQPGENIPPQPNLVVVEVAAASEELDRIESDPTYHVLWRESLESPQSSTARRESVWQSAAKSKFESHLTRQGIDATSLAEVLQPSRQSHGEFAHRLKQWLKARPKQQLPPNKS